MQHATGSAPIAPFNFQLSTFNFQLSSIAAALNDHLSDDD
jgi:hypothetical protein